MKAKSRDSMPKGRKQADVPAPKGESRFPSGGVELGDLLLAELKSRRGRLWQWVQLLTEEFEPQPPAGAAAALTWHRCRPRAGM